MSGEYVELTPAMLAQRWRKVAGYPTPLSEDDRRRAQAVMVGRLS